MIFIAHANYDEELSSSTPKTGVALMLDLRAEYDEQNSPDVPVPTRALRANAVDL